MTANLLPLCLTTIGAALALAVNQPRHLPPGKQIIDTVDTDRDGIRELIVSISGEEEVILNPDGTLHTDPFRAEVLHDKDGLRADGAGIQPGWPITTGGAFKSSPTLANVVGDEQLEVIVGCRDDLVYIWDAFGNAVPNWPQPTGGYVYSTPAVGNLDDDPELEIVVGSWDHWVYAWNADGSVLAGWPQITDGVIAASPALGDIDQDGELEIVIACYYGSTATLYAFNGNGTQASGWPITFAESIHCTTALGDIDDDDKLEVVVGTGGNLVYAFNGENASLVDGWPVGVLGGVEASPALGDIDGDGGLEVIVGDSWWGGHVWAFDGNGDLLDGWPVDVQNNVVASPALADFDDDGTLEIVAPTSIYWDSPIPARVFIFHHDGSVVDNWPVAFTDPDQRIESSPAVADVDRDGDYEIIFGSADGDASPSPALYAFNYDGTLLDSAWPLFGEDVYSSPALEDIDHDGRIEIVVGSWHDYALHCWELDPSSYDVSRLPWPNFHHDNQNTGLFLVPEPTAIPAVSEWGLIVMALLVLSAGTLVYARRRPAQA